MEGGDSSEVGSSEFIPLEANPAINIRKDSLTPEQRLDREGAHFLQEFRQLVDSGYKAKAIAKILNTSVRSVTRFKTDHALHKFADLAKCDVDDIVAATVASIGVECGYRHVCAHILKKHGIRVGQDRVRKSILSQFPDHVTGRRNQLGDRILHGNSTTKYFLDREFLDVNLRLKDFGIVYFGALDGDSRCITALEPMFDLKPLTCYEVWKKKCVRIGLSEQVVCDQGQEFNIIRFAQVYSLRLADEPMTRPAISTKGIQDKVIGERMWAELNRVITDPLKEKARQLVDEGVLVDRDPIDLGSFARVVMPFLKHATQQMVHTGDNSRERPLLTATFRHRPPGLSRKLVNIDIVAEYRRQAEETSTEKEEQPITVDPVPEHLREARDSIVRHEFPIETIAESIRSAGSIHASALANAVSLDRLLTQQLAMFTNWNDFVDDTEISDNVRSIRMGLRDSYYAHS
eukprot:TRINITY_DN5477_c1_g1_i1.p1 TRINITY_DN5477_c1_g1~~TRINITY_DN5477_c1_g1_i1.p1  ORF type:complete len:461 (+),score=28.63 TRINITY_DN5477_c1_g1_i1:125-1507(+)